MLTLLNDDIRTHRSDMDTATGFNAAGAIVIVRSTVIDWLSDGRSAAGECLGASGAYESLEG